MPTIKLTSQLGVTVDAEINPDSTIAKYISKSHNKWVYRKFNKDVFANARKADLWVYTTKKEIDFLPEEEYCAARSIKRELSRVSAHRDPRLAIPRK